MSKYRRTMDLILRLIDEEGLEPGDRLPPEPDLARMSGVSMITARRAVAELAVRGVLVRQQGRGTFVARSRVVSRVAQPGPLRAGIGDGHVALRSHVVRFRQVHAAPSAARFLQVGADTACWEIVRTRAADGAPLLIDRAVIPVALAPGLRADDLEGSSSLYEILEERYDLVDARDEQVLSVVVPLDEERALLRLADNARLVTVEGASFTAANVPFAYFRLLFDADRFAFRIDGEQARIVPVPRELDALSV
ncbi:MAG: GntR family transcriptional regulator [Chloroflexota bacterium]